MLFNSWEFVALVLATMLLFYQPALRSIQVLLLITSSFIFYGSHQPWLLLLLVFSVAVNAFTSWMVFHASPDWSKFWAILGVTLNLGVLGFFKYAGLFARTFDLKQGLTEFLYAIPLPIGISFFTFQGISLVADTFKECKSSENQSIVQENLKDHFLFTVFYVSFFPQLVAGPIVKAHEFLPQIKTKWFKDIDWLYCFKTLVTGYFLKMVVADNLKDWTFWIQYPYFLNRSSIDLIVMLFGFSMQIFADFAGYSLIAMGIAGLFGYRLPQNFNYPYVATSFSDFWRRWHISLSSWLRDYLYFPLGGNRKGSKRTYFNLFIVMFLGGLWHGAAWCYAIWGTAHGIALAIERFFRKKISIPDTLFSRTSKRLVVFVFVTLAWVLFKLPDFDHAVAFFNAIVFNTERKPSLTTAYYIGIFSLPVVIYHLHYLWSNESIKMRLEPWFFGGMLFCLSLNSGSVGTFIYFQF